MRLPLITHDLSTPSLAIFTQAPPPPPNMHKAAPTDCDASLQTLLTAAVLAFVLPPLLPGQYSAAPSTLTSSASQNRHACAGHKFIGAPVPCGVVITRACYIERLSTNVEYLNSRDATIMGSRNGHAPIYMWYTLTLKGYEGMRKDVERCLRNAHLLKVGLASRPPAATRPSPA